MNSILVMCCVPVLFALAVFLFPWKKTGLKYLTLGGCLAGLFAFVSMCYGYQTAYDARMTVDFWPSLGLPLSMSVDGLSLLMLGITAVCMLLVAFTLVQEKAFLNKPFLSLFFCIYAALVGLFTATDMVVFYVFWELAVIPVFFLMYLFRRSKEETPPFQFLLYTLASSVFMLFALICLHSPFSDMRSGLIFASFFIAFAIKIPLFPFHGWQPHAYSRAPIPVTMIMASLLSKMGIYGLLRLFESFPEFVFYYKEVLLLLLLVGVLYASLLAFVQKDLKRLFAYASIAHLGVIAAGAVVSKVPMAYDGVLLQLIAHSVGSVAFFGIVQVLYSRYKTTRLDELGGLFGQSRFFSATFFVAILSGIAFPLTAGFSGEFLILTGLFSVQPYLTAGFALSMVLGAVYLLRAYHAVMFGTAKSSVPLVPNGWEKVAFAVIVLLLLGFGLFPNAVLTVINPSLSFDFPHLSLHGLEHLI